MLYYEVEVRIEKSIQGKYEKWLHEHVQEMLKIDAFDSAAIFFGLPPEKEKLLYLIRYTLSSREKLENYFQNQATAMRAEAQKYFSNQFQAKRRILEEKD